MIQTMFVNRNGTKVLINKHQFNPAIESAWKDPVVTDDSEKYKLISDLAELGIKKDKRSSVESLREALEEAMNA